MIKNHFCRRSALRHHENGLASLAISRVKRCAAQRRVSRHSAFTLIEIMVALSIFLVMLAIIFVPLTMSLNLFSIGKTRSNVLQAAQSTLDGIEGDLRKAIMVFPNAALENVTYTVSASGAKSPKAPYGPTLALNPEGHPYIKVAASGYGVCDAGTANAIYVDNPHRLDFLLPDTFNTTTNEDQVQALMPLRAAPYLVTYYYRRQIVEKDYNNDGDTTDPGEQVGADPLDNPIVLFRAQMPYREHDANGTVMRVGTATAPALPARNVNLLPMSQGTEPPRYPDPANTSFCGSNSTPTNRGSYWLKQLATAAQPLNEANLEPLTKDNATLGASPAPTPLPETLRSHIAVLPKGIVLVARNAYDTTPDYTPDTTFACADTNGDGKIDQVTVTLVVASFDDAGADRSNSLASDNSNNNPNYSVNSQKIRQTRVITLSNVR